MFLQVEQMQLQLHRFKRCTNIILNAEGETVTCMFKNSNWNIIAGNGYTTS